MTTTPTHIFILPYRDRELELQEWVTNMHEYLDNQIGESCYEVLVVHQLDNKMFNRGALCNIGFLYSKSMYPDIYKNIQFIIHDVDIYPVKVEGKEDIIKYSTIKGKARHPYGVLRPQLGGTLGGICIIYGEDYEQVSGMPNYYGWGGEDVGLSRRCQAHKIRINEDNFIDRRSTPLIIDPESHVTAAKKKVIMATDKLNLRKALRENSLQPNDGLSNIKYTVDNTKKINGELSNWNMIDVKFSVF